MKLHLKFVFDTGLQVPGSHGAAGLMDRFLCHSFQISKVALEPNLR